jgi:hypothetical protein
MESRIYNRSEKIILANSLKYKGLNLNPGNFGGSTLLCVSCGETCLLVS